MTTLYKPRPERWPQVSLKGFFVLLTLLCVFLGWLGMQVKWIRDRHAFREACRSLPGVSAYFEPFRTQAGVYDPTCRAPSALWLFGERGVKHITVPKRYEARIRRLFPEADVRIMPGWERTVEDLKRLNRQMPGYYKPSIYDE
jgi:hypothetical protein